MRRYFLCVFMIILALTGCKNVGEKEIKINLKVEVETVGVTTQVLEDRVQAVGEVKAEKEVLLSSQFDGRIVLLNFLPGDKVKEGTLIAKIRTKEAEAISRTLKGEFSDISIVSPLTGIVVKRYVSEGDVVAKGQPIVKIVSRRPLYLLIDVPQEYFQTTKAGDKVEFVIGEKTYTGRITAKTNAVDPLTGTFKVRAKITGKDLLPGVFGRVWIVTERKSCTAVPRDTVLTKNGEKVVFVIEGNYAKMRKVKAGIVTNKFVEIKEGLRQGEQVVTLGNYELEDGMEVKVKQR